MNPAAETDETLNALPAFQPPATMGEAWDANAQAAGLSAPVGVQQPRREATNELLDGYQRATGKSVFDAAADAGMPISSWAYSGGRLTGMLGAKEQSELTGVAGVLASRLPDAQARQLEPYLDVDARAAEKAQKIESQAADVNARTYGLTDNAAGWLGGLARGLADPTSIAGALMGGPESGSLLSMLSREFAVNAGVGAAAHVVNAPERERLGLQNGSLIGDAFAAGVYGTGISLLLRGAGWSLKRAIGREGGEPPPPGYTPHDRPPADLLTAAGDLAPEDFEAAARRQDRDTAMDAIAPVQTFEGRAQARVATDTAAASIETGELAAEGTAHPLPPAEAGAVRSAAPAEAPRDGENDPSRPSEPPFPGDDAPPAPRPPGPPAAPSWREPSAGKAPSRPETLRAFIKRLGGVKDEHGDLKDLRKGYPGLINNKGGMDLDEAREAAAEAGYFGFPVGDRVGDTTMGDMVDALRDDAGRYSGFDEAVAREFETHRQHAAWIEQVHIHAREVDAWMAETGEKLDAELRWTVAEHIAEDKLHGDGQMSADDAVERAVRMLYERDARAARAAGETVHEAGNESRAGTRASDAGGGDGRNGPREVGGARPEVRDAGAAGRPAGREGSAEVAPANPALAAQRADVERGLAAAEADGQDILFQDANGAAVSARDVLSAVDEFKGAARELGACILKFGE